MPHPRTSILLGVSGSSAASATGGLLDLLHQFIAPHVTTICSPAGARFIDLPPAAYLDDTDWRHDPLHVDVTAAAQEFIVYPASANTIAKAALGLADNLLTTCVLAYPRPIWWVPCTNQALWNSPTTRAHVAALRDRGHHVLSPRPMPGLGQGGHTTAMALTWREVIDTILRTYLTGLDAGHEAPGHTGPGQSHR